MQKKSVLSIILSLFLINFVSAYGLYSLGDIFYRIDPSVLVSIILFIIFFAFLNYILSRVFMDKHGNSNIGTSVVISLCISTLIVYWINRSYWIENLLYNLQIENLFLYILLGVIIIFVLWLIFRRRDSKIYRSRKKQKRLKRRIRELKRKFFIKLKM